MTAAITQSKPSAVRSLLALGFWSGVGLFVLGLTITFYPGAEQGWFLTTTALLLLGLAIPTTWCRKVAVALSVLSLLAVLKGHERGAEYRKAHETQGQKDLRTAKLVP